MSETWVMLGFFALVMAVVTAAGYLWLARGQGLAVAGSDSALVGVLLSQMFQSVGRAVPATEKESGALRRRLVAAGYRAPSTVPLFSGLKCAAALLLCLGLGWGVTFTRGELTPALLSALLALVFGYSLPDRILVRMTAARRGRIRRGLPDALDLLVLCVEAGHSLDQAIIDAGVELKQAYPDLSAELTLTHLELRAGASRAEALQNLAGRNGEPELKKLASLLIQADRFGTSLGPALRVHAKYLRIRAKQKAEETARKISIKLLFPIFFLIFPCMMIITAGPAVLQIMTQLLPMVSGSE